AGGLKPVEDTGDVVVEITRPATEARWDMDEQGQWHISRQSRPISDLGRRGLAKVDEPVVRSHGSTYSEVVQGGAQAEDPQEDRDDRQQHKAGRDQATADDALLAVPCLFAKRH